MTLSNDVPEDVLPLCSSSRVVVRSTPYTGEANARGVFANCDIKRGTLIERAHCLRFSAEEHVHAMQTTLQHYTFSAGGGEYFLALGIGSLFNHADPPNVEFRIQRGKALISYYACRDILIGDELCIFYGKHLWFNDAAATPIDGATSAAPRDEDADGDPLPFS